MGFFDKLKSGLEKTKNAFFGQLNSMFRAFVKVDEDFLEELEDMLISADVGVETSEEIISELREKAKDDRLKSGEDVKNALRDILREKIGDGEALKLTTSPSVILVIGVNGVGKTTTIGKISARLADEGKKVVIAAADTFRAAAIDQLEVWCERSGAELIKQSEGSDPAAVVFDAAAAARKRRADVLIVDTAGRLHNKKNLMDELAKMRRIITRDYPEANVEALIVLDGTTGQNALEQARQFSNVTELDGIVITKLDGTAKGGIAIAIQAELDVPVKFIGVGEKIGDLQRFDPQEYVNALFADFDEDRSEIDMLIGDDM